MPGRSLFVTAAVIGLALPAQAQESAQGAAAPDYVAAIRACDTESDRTRKLDCLERASGAIVAAVDSGELRLVDRKEREKQRRGLFGFSLPSIFGGDDKKDGESEMAEMQTLVSTVTSVRQVDRKTYVFRIAEANAEWEIREAPSRFTPPKVGDTVEFKKAAMNSYFIRVGKQIGVKGKRIG